MGNFLSLFTGRGPSYTGTIEQQAEQHRQEAHRLAEQQRSLSSRSQAAFKSGNGALAKELSLQAKALHAQVDFHNKEAAKLHFQAHNVDQPSGTIDLHGLFVKEAIQALEKAADDARKEKTSDLIVIVGAGNHSKDGVQRLRPAVEKWCRDRGHTFDVMNPGCLRIHLKSRRCCKIM